MTAKPDRRVRFLQEMGVGPIWTLREQSGQAPKQSSSDNSDSVPAPLSLTGEESLSAPDAGGAKTIALDVSSDDMAWNDAALRPAAIGEGANTAPSAAEIARMDWEQLQAAVSVCTKCRLCETRKQTVFGAGTRKAKWLFVGEGPGYNEDLQGEPFIGAAGKLLDNMLAAMGLKRGVNAFIANIVKCRAADDDGRDRPPTADESAACLPYLERQIALIQPNVIVALGKTAALTLLGQDPNTPVSKLRGSVHQYVNVPLVVTYHPAYLLRKLDDKSKAWRDLCLAMQAYADASAQS
jgi:uracil-DNA glycosylase family 4